MMCCVFATGLLLVNPTEAFAQNRAEIAEREWRVKAEFLYHLLHYVQFPTPKKKGVKSVIGIYGAYPHSRLKSRLTELAAASTRSGFPLEFAQFDSIKDYKPCDVLFVSPRGRRGQTLETRWAAAVEKTKGKPVVIVTDSPGFALKEGVAVNMRVAQNRVRLDLNQGNAADRGLKFDSRLLGLTVVTIVK
ncbi:MAG: YfiR family protein [Planctomycetales bacterium]